MKKGENIIKDPGWMTRGIFLVYSVPPGSASSFLESLNRSVALVLWSLELVAINSNPPLPSELPTFKPLLLLLPLPLPLPGMVPWQKARSSNPEFRGDDDDDDAPLRMNYCQTFSNLWVSDFGNPKSLRTVPLSHIPSDVVVRARIHAPCNYPHLTSPLPRLQEIEKL